MAENFIPGIPAQSPRVWQLRRYTAGSGTVRRVIEIDPKKGLSPQQTPATRVPTCSCAWRWRPRS